MGDGVAPFTVGLVVSVEVMDTILELDASRDALRDMDSAVRLTVTFVTVLVLLRVPPLEETVAEFDCVEEVESE